MPSLKIVSVPPISAVPTKVGAVSLVRLSVVDEPVSVVAARSGADGADGAVVSIDTDRPAVLALTLPAASVALAVMLCVPPVSTEDVML